MIAGLVAVLLAGAAFGSVSPYLADRAAAAATPWLLSVGGLAVATASWVAVGACAVGVFGRMSWLAEAAGYSPHLLDERTPIPLPYAVLALAVVLSAGTSALAVTYRGVRQLRHAWVTARSAGAGLIVLESGRHAYAVPGRPGCVVVSRPLLKELSPSGRRALLAHEHAHLDEHHELAVLAASVAAAMNPLLHRLIGAVRHATERRADSAAARATGDPRVVADTIVRIAAPQLAPYLLGGAGADVGRRVAGLTGSRRRSHRLLVAALIVIAALLIVVTYGALLRLGHGLDAVLDGSHLPGVLAR